MMKNLHIGTSGWSYKHWKDVYYPAGLAATKWLTFHAKAFSTTEINASFYNLPKQETVIKWMQMVPPEFKFCPKMSRYLTHMKKLRNPEESLERFFTVFAPMQKMMGPVLIQLPPSLKFNYDVAEHLYKILKKTYRKYEFVMEIRHRSWMEEDNFTLMTKYDIGFVISQSGNEFPYSEMVTAKNIYLRFHGPKELYASAYNDTQLEYYANKIRNWVNEGHVIWVYFNNDIHAHAIRDSKRLMAMC